MIRHTRRRERGWLQAAAIVFAALIAAAPLHADEGTLAAEAAGVARVPAGASRRRVRLHGHAGQPAGGSLGVASG